MEKKTFNMLMMLIVLSIGAIVGWAVPAGEPVLVVAPVLVGMTAIYFMKKRVAGVVADEMSYRVAERAARLTYAVFSTIAALSGGVLIAVRDMDPVYEIAGYTLAYSVNVLLLIFWGFYVYYSRKGV